MKDIIAKRLRYIMNEKKVNQVELAKAICVGQSTISSWLSAKKHRALFRYGNSRTTLTYRSIISSEEQNFNISFDF